MRKLLLTLAAALALPALANAETYVVCDFENHEIGQSVPLWNRYGAAPAATARVVADPADANNKVLLVDLKEWNDYTEFILPAGYAGAALTENFNTITFDFCLAGGENYKQMHVFLGDDMLYSDSQYPHQGNQGQWSTRSYDLGAVPAANASDRLRVGLCSNATSYYIDNIVLARVDKIQNSDYLIDYTPDFTDATPMRDYAAQAAKGIGVAVPVWKGYLDHSEKSSLISSNFNMVVAENCMKFDAIHPSQDTWNFGAPDGLVNFAARNGMAVRGHTLVWHSQLAKWVSSDGYKNDHNYTRTQLLDIMKGHIDKVVGRYKGKVREWDVVNECLDDDQSVVWGDRNAYNFRKSVWQQVIGEDFIAKAFEYAHAADPDAILYLNDYGVEFMGRPKADAFFNLAKSLVEKGVPIHGVGLQSHLTVGDFDAAAFVANIRRFEEIGLKCIVTELDIAQTGGADAEARQAIEYCEIVNAALSEPNCPTVMVWGMFDNDSWRQGNPLLFNSSMQPKEAFYAVHGVLRHLAANSGIDDIIGQEAAEIVATEYYNIQGMRVTNPAPGIYIRRTLHSDGTSRTAKVLIK